MAKNLKDAGPQAYVADIVYSGEQLILPEGMAIPDAMALLKRRQEFLEEAVNITETFDVFPWDGAYLLDRVLTRKFGWSAATATPGFFGPQPPKLISIDTGPSSKIQVPWGAFSLPKVDGLLHTNVAKKGARFVFNLVAQVKRKDEALVQRIFEELRAEAASCSLYRGKAIKMRFRGDDGKPLQMPEPKFMDVSNISREQLIYSDDVTTAVETSLFTPIERVQDCLDNGLPVKRGVLLGGTFGTGKTLAATVASKLAVDHGITYLYVPRADELSDAIEFGKQYQSPACVIFCEDIDRVMDGERDVAMDDILNIIDGIDTKSANIITVLTTNELNNINPAMLRPGRLDAVIEVTPPDAKAVERLLRHYGGEAIDASTDLAEAGRVLAGNIPAVIAEVVKRAKLAQLRLQPVGEPVKNLSSQAIVDAAKTMKMQLDLLKARTEAVKPDLTADRALETLVQRVVDSAAGDLNQKIVKIAAGVGVEV
jgi:transitional endoplasmic reticulum ATPase